MQFMVKQKFQQFQQQQKPLSLNLNKNKKRIPTISSTLPKPKTGNQYSPNEVIEILSPYRDRSSTRATIINQIVRDKLIPITRSAVYKLLDRHKLGNGIRSNWNEVGRESLLQTEDIQKIVNEMNVHNGSTIASDEIKKLYKINKMKFLMKKVLFL